MRLKHTIQLFLSVLAIAGAFLVLQSSTPTSKNAPCKESMDASSCNKKESADKMIWENLSQQFFSSF
ncbi:MAG TPA: hypothetical protein VJU78_15770 [Chitinophagaceae bacterium]|nr:hypothetical protein [Chitinophagaceae bacterium]